MHSCLNRAQSVFGFFTTVALVVSALAALSVVLFPTDEVKTAVELKNVHVVKGRPHYYSSKREEYAQLRFDLDADLSPLFNWNTKQLFVYVYATYSSSDRADSAVPASEAVVWDAIIPATPSPYSWDALLEKATELLPTSIASSIFSSSSSSAKRASKRAKKPLTKKTGSKKPAASSKEEAAATSAPGLLRLRDQKSKYQISDITGRLVERKNVTLSVGWNVQPWVGALWWSPRSGAVPHTAGSVGTGAPFDFPALKGSKKAAEGKKESV
ncbi:Signal peptidase 22kDa subunit [Penicillium alfredii]|uniref:Signal peptidase subunit 3 n=1 Tax=Penicillium alfredii TaxID=1506179 RepID=A0A9W9KFK9_9EURO|nr:Signal peptidase 22kDa subunit [Penicillium alfredii]KAJ5104669.1 Signal peptidase 22kDa subunit [Penicillium alfredii]